MHRPQHAQPACCPCPCSSVLGASIAKHNLHPETEICKSSIVQQEKQLVWAALLNAVGRGRGPRATGEDMCSHHTC